MCSGLADIKSIVFVCCILDYTLNEVTENIMKKLTTTLMAVITATLAFSSSIQAAQMNHYMESALADVCKAAMSNKIHKLNNTTKAYNLNDKTVALKVICNGDDIITFAEKNGAFKTADKLQKSIGYVNIIEMETAEMEAVENSQVTVTQ